MRKLYLFIFFFVILLSARAQPVKIPIDTARWYQLNHTAGNLAKLFDGNKSTKAFTGWSKVLYNYDAYYPLLGGEEMVIDSIRIYDSEGIFTNAPLRLYAVSGTWERKLIATFTGEMYNVWVGPYPDRRYVFKLDTAIRDIRYLQLNINDNNFPGEIELYGRYTPPATPTAPVPAPERVALRNMFGINGFVWNYIDPTKTMVINEDKYRAMAAFSGLRQYMDWEKLEEVEGRYTFSPQARGGWHCDTLYTRLLHDNIDVLATLQNIPPWMVNTYPDSLKAIDNNPVRYGSDLTHPLSYIEQAKVGFQYAARYGRNTNIDSSLVSVYTIPAWPTQPVNSKKIGLGLVRYIECGNEQNKWWKGRIGYLTGREYAAALSAFYDGHKNTMGPGVGVKNADSTMVVVMTGLASLTTDYVRGMIDWCKEFRGYKPDGRVNLCFDVINFHLYANDAGSSQSGGATRGAAPERSNCAQVAQAFLQLAATELYNMPVWNTEHGYDTNQGSPYKAIAVGGKTVLETQADWVLRSALLYAREGLQKTFFFQAFDANSASSTKFASMGLLNKENMTRKPAADFLYQTARLFGDYIFQESTGTDPIIDRYAFNGRSMYMVVVPDEKGRTATCTLQLGNVDSAAVYTPVPGSDDMAVQKLPVVGGQLVLTATERPVFVVPDQTVQFNSITHKKYGVAGQSLLTGKKQPARR